MSTAVATPTSIPFHQPASASFDPADVTARAKSISDKIDATLAEEKARKKARKEAGDVSLLLLGQSESGKSTLLKQFQLIHSQSTFDDERQSWKPVVYLNILNTIRNILNLIKEERSQPDSKFVDNESTACVKRLEERTQEFLSCEEKLVAILINSGHVPSPTTTAGGSQSSKTVYMRRQIQRSSRLSLDGETEGLKKLSNEDITSLEVIASSLNGVQNDVQELWRVPYIQRLVKERLSDDWRSYCIAHLERITSPYYIPTDDDILRVRIMTMGVVEHTFRVAVPSTSLTAAFGKKSSSHNGRAGKEIDMRIYDVGGARGQRHAWASYFDEATAIIFLAPISAFDQYLVEDPEMNRLHDSIDLFQKICDNPLLSNIELVLFLNKIDLLERKLKDGVQIKDFVSSYAENPNTAPFAQKFFAAHFQAIFMRSQGKHQGKNRSLFVHFTSVVDTKTTRVVIANVQDSILKSALKDAKLM